MPGSTHASLILVTRSASQCLIAPLCASQRLVVPRNASQYLERPHAALQCIAVKSSMARSLPMENLQQKNVLSIVNDLHAESTEVAQWGTHSCSRIQPATDNGVRDGSSN